MKTMGRLMVLMLAAVLALSGVAFAGDVVNAAGCLNCSAPVPQPVGATRFFSQFELQNGLRYRVLVAKPNGTVEAALDPSRIDYLESAGGGDAAGGTASGGDAGGGGDSK